jgi:hypothetical protein
MNKHLAAALIALQLLAVPALAANDVSSSNWAEADASNSVAAPNGFPEGMAPSSVNDAARMVMGAVKRFWDRINGTQVTTNSGNAYTLTYTVAPAAYVTGEAYTFKVNAANTAAATLAIAPLPAVNLFKASRAGPVALVSGDLQPGNYLTAIYDGTEFVISGMPSNLGTVQIIGTAGLATGGPIAVGGTVTVTAATKSDMQAGSNISAAVTPAVVGQADGVAKASASFVSNTFVAGFNIASANLVGTGLWSFTFSTPMASANFVVVATSHWRNRYVYMVSGSKYAGGFQLQVTGGDLSSPAPDGNDFDFVVFGRQ